MLNGFTSFLRGRRVFRVALYAPVLVATAACGSLVTVSSSLATPGPACATPGPASQADSFHTPVQLMTTSTGLQYGDIRVGCGATPRRGQIVTIEYSGWLSNGTLFDTSRTPARQAFSFPLAASRVIPGVDLGVATMRVGGKRRLVVPPFLAYGPQGVPPVIPPSATLIFDVELISISG